MGVLEDLMSSNLSGDKEDNRSKVDVVIDDIKNGGFVVNEMEPIIRNENKYQLVESVAGSGKTTTLNFKLLADVYSGRAWNKPIWVSTFLKSGAEALRQDFMKKAASASLAIPMNNIVFGTIHSEFYRVLRSIGLDINIIKPEVDRAMKNDISKELGIGNYPGFLNNQELQIFDTIETYVNSCIEKPDVEELVKLDVDDLTSNYPALLKAIELLHEKRLVLEQYSFDDLQQILYEYLYVKKNPYLINIIRNRYKFIYIDEFQDTSRIQYEIMKIYCENAEQVVFVGDSDQSIYSWRGADVDIITKDLEKDYDIDIKKLTKNYRVPKNILDPIAKSIKHNQNRIDKPIVASEGGGVLSSRVYSNQFDMDSDIPEILEQAYNDDDMNSIAVLASTNLDITGLSLSLLLDKTKNYDFDIGGTVQNLDRKTYKQFWRLAYIFSNQSNHELKENLITLSQREIRRYQAGKVEEVIRNQGGNLLDISADTLVTQFSRHLGLWRNYIGDVRGIEGVLMTFEYLLRKYDNLIGEGTPNASIYEDYIRKLNLMIRIISSNDAIKTPEDFLNEIQRLNDRLKSIHDRKHRSKIILTTPFDFKGKEADFILVYSDINTNFPRVKSNNMEEERRLHYIAGTRAKKKCVYTTIFGRESPFLKEMGILKD